MDHGSGDRGENAATGAAPPSRAAIIAVYLDTVMRKDASAVERYFAPDIEYVVNGSTQPDPTGSLPPLSTECGAALLGSAFMAVERHCGGSSKQCIGISRSPDSVRVK